MPKRAEIPGGKVTIVQCQPHRQSREGQLVIFLRLSRRPPPDLLEILRVHGSYRKGPGGESGWHLNSSKELVQAIKPQHDELARQLYTAARLIRKSPETIEQSNHGSRRRERRTMDVVKVG